METNSQTNKNVDLLTGKPEVAVKKLAIPIMIAMLLTASYNIIDGVWVVGLGQVAIAGIGFVNPIYDTCWCKYGPWEWGHKQYKSIYRC